MKYYFSFVFAGLLMLLPGAVMAQNAALKVGRDTVSVLSAELNLQNATKDTTGFLYNTGKGRTIFKRIRLETIGDTALALPGLDTVSLAAKSLYSGDGMLTGDRTVYGAGHNFTLRGAPTVLIESPDTNTLIFMQDGRLAMTSYNGLFTEEGSTLSLRGTWRYQQSTNGPMEFQANGGFLFDGDMNFLSLKNSAPDSVLTTDYTGKLVLTKIPNGTFAGAVQATSFVQASQRALKRDIAPFTASAMELLEKAAVQTFIYKADSSAATHIGFIAEDVPAEMASPGRTGVDEANTVALLVKALQELKTEVSVLRKELDELKAEKKEN